MTLVERFELPGSLPDFRGWPFQQEAWHEAMSGYLDTVASQARFTLKALRRGSRPTAQFYNPARQVVRGPMFEQAITWNAFPLELIRRFGHAQAMVQADRLWPVMPNPQFTLDQEMLSAPHKSGTAFFRPQTEYCEWRVEREPGTGRMLRVTFTCEPPEYWRFLNGESCLDLGQRERLQQLLLKLYRKLVDRAVQPVDLTPYDLDPRVRALGMGMSTYNPFNRWNTTHGIAHLCCPANSLPAELELAALATISCDNAAGQLLTYPDALCTASPLIGHPNRRSDMAIIGTINALARQQRMVTLANPAGICMDHIDTSSWKLPAGITPRQCWKISRGCEGSMARLIVEVPPKTGFTLSDLNIAGEPLRHGGQLAECVTMRLDIMASNEQSVPRNRAKPTTQNSLLVPGEPPRILIDGWTGPRPAGSTVAFAEYDIPNPAAAAPGLAPTRT